MLELTPPLWLFTTRPGDTPVPESERHRLGAAIRARIDGSAQSDTALVLSSRLAERVRAVGQFPTEAEEIVRGALRELGLRPPLRITVERESLAGGEPVGVIVFDGAGVPIEESADSVDPSVTVLRTARNERWVRGFVRAIGERLLGIPRAELDAVVAALHEKYSRDAGPRAIRAATRLLVRYVEARSDHPLRGDAAAQIAWLVYELAKRSSDGTLIVESMPQQPGCAGIVLSRHPATGEPGPIVEAVAFEHSEECRIATWADLARLAGDGIREIESRLLDAERARGRIVGARFEIEGNRICGFEPFDTELSLLARIRTVVAHERTGVLTRGEALRAIADLEDLALRIPIRIEDGVIAPIARAGIASIGVRSGRLALSAEQAAHYRRAGFDVVAVFEARTRPPLFDLALGRGVVLLGEGIDSEPARAARRIGVPALVFEDAILDRDRAELVFGDEFVREGDPVTLDAWSGGLFAGELPIVDRVMPPECETIARWRSEIGKTESAGELGGAR